MDPVLNIFRATDELDAPGIPKKTKDDLENFCNYATDYCLSYVNEPSVGLWHIQNHIHDKILPKNNQMKSKLLETLQECREVSLELDSAIEHTHIWKTDGDNKGESDSIVDTACENILSDTLDVCKDVNKLLRKVAEKRQTLALENKAVDDVITESAAEGGNKNGESRERANSFEAWYKTQFKS